MKAHRPAALATTILILAACNPFAKKPVEISSGEVAYSSRWNATLATPSNLTGAVQVKGSAWMAPGTDQNSTVVHVDISNAVPGGVHPWYVHRGRCGNDQGIVGESSDYSPLRVQSDGTASGQASLSVPEPTSGDFFVSVLASPSNLQTTIACGNLAPPVR